MAVTVLWDETDPLSSKNPKLGAGDITNGKVGTRERLTNGGHKWESGAATAVDTDAGKHMCGVQGTTGELVLAYEEDADSLVTLRDDTYTPASDASIVTIGDGIDGSQPYTLVADTLQGKRVTTMMIPIPLDATGIVSGLYYENLGDGTLKLLGARLICSTVPTGGDLQVDINIQASSWTDPDAAGASIFTNEPVVATGANKGTLLVATDISNDELEVGEIWNFEVDSINSADGAVLLLEVQRTQ